MLNGSGDSYKMFSFTTLNWSVTDEKSYFQAEQVNFVSRLCIKLACLYQKKRVLWNIYIN